MIRFAQRLDMSFTRSLAMRMFGRPHGLLGRLGGRLMARMNAEFGAWVAGQLEVGARERVLEVGFGAGVIIGRLAELAPDGHVAGVDPSVEMVAQARARNAKAGGAGSLSSIAARSRVCRSPPQVSTRRWRSTRCRCGPMRWLDCAR
jgi:SAM-dependent methyltransferase